MCALTHEKSVHVGFALRLVCALKSLHTYAIKDGQSHVKEVGIREPAQTCDKSDTDKRSAKLSEIDD